MRSSWRNLLPLILFGCSSAETERVSRSQLAIRDGVADEEHDGVVMLHQRSGMLCSGYLITPDRVLTARHCVSDTTHKATTACEAFALPVLPPSDVAVAWPARMTSDTELIALAESIAVVPKELECDTDVAIVRLAKPIEGRKLIVPRLYLPAVVEETFTAVGYGLDGATPKSQGLRRQLGGLHVAHLGPWNRDDGKYVAGEGDWVADRGPCGGDSGGPALDVSGRSIGIMLRGRQTVCELMGYQGFPKVADFVREEARASIEALAATGAAVPELAWLDAPPEASAKLGEDCWSSTQCAEGLACLPLTDRIRCTVPSCDACGEGTTCDEAPDGLRTCAPVVAPASSDAGRSAPKATPKTTSSTNAGGCSFGGTSGAPGLGAACVVFGVLARRRRRP